MNAPKLVQLLYLFYIKSFIKIIKLLFFNEIPQLVTNYLYFCFRTNTEKVAA